MVLHTRVVPLLLVALVVAAGCSSDNPRATRDPLIAPTPLPTPVPQPTHVEYRVTGTIRDVTITYSNSVQGTTQVTTDLPWFVAFDTFTPTTFVYLQADAPKENVDEGSLLVQIFVDGAIFREARAFGFVPSVAASGEVVR